MSILVVGSVALDTVKTPLGKCRSVLGGSATYASISASFFGRVNLVAVVGKDFPEKHLELFRKKKIDLKGLEFKTGKTFRWEGEYGWDFNVARTIGTHLNVFAHFNPRIPQEYKNSKYLFLGNIDPQIQEDVLGQVKRPRLVACDTMNYWIANKRKHLVKILKKVDVFLLNDAEARELSGKRNLVAAGRKILKLGPRRVIIKKGEHGALLFSENSVFSAPAFLLETITDPTGAGDTFAGGVVGYLSQCRKINDESLRRAIIYGTVMATFAVEDFSLRRLGHITRANITSRFEAFKKLTRF